MSWLLENHLGTVPTYRAGIVEPCLLGIVHGGCQLGMVFRSEEGACFQQVINPAQAGDMLRVKLAEHSGRTEWIFYLSFTEGRWLPEGVFTFEKRVAGRSLLVAGWLKTEIEGI